MRRATLTIAAAACAVPAALVLWPMCAALADALRAPASGAHSTDDAALIDALAAWRTTASWAIGAAMAAAALGWLPGRALGQRLHGGRGVALAGLLVAIASIPPYATFFCLWRLIRPGTAIADAAAVGGWVPELRAAVLGVALAGWLWPLVACCVALVRWQSRSPDAELLELDRAGWRDRLVTAWREDRMGLAISALLSAIAVIGETAACDVAQVRTIGTELRLAGSAGAGARALWEAGWPALVIAGVASILMTARMWRARHVAARLGTSPEREGVRCRARLHPGAAVAWLLAAAAIVPISLLFADAVPAGAWSGFRSLHASASLRSLAAAAAGGAVGALVALLACAHWLVLPRGGWTLPCAGSLWMLGAALPATLVCSGYEAAWNAASPLRALYDSEWIVPLAQVAHLGIVPWVAGTWIARVTPREHVELDALFGGSPKAWLRAHGPRLARAAACGWVLSAGLCAGETVIAARLLPPGADWIAPVLLNAVHYQDQSTVLAVMPWMVGIAALCGACAAVVALRSARLGSQSCAVPLIALAMVACIACDRREARETAGAPGTGGSHEASAGPAIDPADRGGAGFAAMTADVRAADDAPAPLDVSGVIGMRGRMPGRLDYPRAADVSPDGSVVVIDKSGRVQRFRPDGTLATAWRMPRTANGMPTGVTIDRHGRAWIADTHEHRILVCDGSGGVIASFGAYGREPGQFVYPTDVLVLDDAQPSRCSVVVSEYGGNDRLQWIDVELPAAADPAADPASPPTARTTPVRAVGRQGTGDGEFLRPQSMARAPDGTIAVADACNHRIVRLSADGTWLGTLGAPGRGFGELSYPYGVLACPDGSLLVAEFGNNRIQCLDSRGRPRWVRGGGGRESGRLVAPWAVVGDPAAPIVVDAGNCRLVRINGHAGPAR